MNPHKVVRQNLRKLTDLPNIGSAGARDLQRLGIERPEQLKGKSPFTIYRQLCELTGSRQDPCVLDVFISVTRFMAGEPPQAWWNYTAERKEKWPGL